MTAEWVENEQSSTPQFVLWYGKTMLAVAGEDTNLRTMEKYRYARLPNHAQVILKAETIEAAKVEAMEIVRQDLRDKLNAIDNLIFETGCA